MCHFLYGFLISFFLEANDRTYKPIRSLDTRPKCVRGIVLWLFLNTFPCTTWRLFIFPLKVVAFLPAPSTSVISILFSPPSSLKFKVIETKLVSTPRVTIYRFAVFDQTVNPFRIDSSNPVETIRLLSFYLNEPWTRFDVTARASSETSRAGLCGHCYFTNRDVVITNCDERMVYRSLRYLAPFPLHRYLEMFQRKQYRGKIAAWNCNDARNDPRVKCEIVFPRFLNVYLNR